MNVINSISIRKHAAFIGSNLLVLLCLFLTINSCIAQIQIGQNIDGTAENDYSGFGVAISANGKRTVIGSKGNDGNGMDAGHARVFEEINGTWIQIGQDIEGEGSFDQSGSSVSISANGKRIAIGAPMNSGNGTGSGHVRIYEEINGNWVQIGQDLDGEAAGDESGRAISISGNGLRIAIGAGNNNGNGSYSGHVRIYEELNGTWVQIGQDIDGEAAGDVSGDAVSISENGKRVAIGALHNDQNGQSSGQVRVFEEVNGTWSQIGADIDGDAADDYLGIVSISADGTIVAVGATRKNSIGRVTIYQEVNGNWVQLGQDIDGDIPNENFGSSISISSDGTKVAIANRPASIISRVLIYEIQNGIWSQVGVDMSGGIIGNNFGFSTSISGDGRRVAIGAYSHDVFWFGEGRTQIYQIVESDAFSNYLTGNVIHDLNLNCQQDPTEPGLQNWFLQAVGANGISYGLTDSSGYYKINVDSGSYKLNITTPNSLWIACQPAYNINVSSNDTIQTDFIANAIDCPHLVVDISTPFLRRCFNNSYYVSYCNDGTIPATNAYLEVTFPSQIQVDSSTLPWNTPSGNVYTFTLGTIDPGVCGSFKVNTTVICDSTIIGETLCVQAHIYPDSICVSSGSAWEGSVTTLDVECQQDSVVFTIKNTGQGNMLTPLEYFVIEDELILKQAPFMLNSMDSILVKVPSNGSTYRLYAGQSPGHFPTSYFPSIAIEGCGVNSNGTFSMGFITMFNENDIQDQVAIDCREIIGSFDPNDKQAQPKGYGTEHYIEVDDDLNYHIRFQNVGTDTAFTVVIRDTISPHLNIASLQQGTASHPYQLEIENGNILKFNFNDILLVDSTTNEPASHGFVKFKISQLDSLPIGTMIYNSAGIYFDYNEPVITNETYHEIGEDFIMIAATSHSPALEYPKVTISVQPNPFTNFADFILDGAPQGDKSFELYDAMGRLIQRDNFSDDFKHRLYKNGLSSGIYFYKILNNNNLLISGKLVAGQ